MAAAVAVVMPSTTTVNSAAELLQGARQAALEKEAEDEELRKLAKALQEAKAKAHEDAEREIDLHTTYQTMIRQRLGKYLVKLERLFAARQYINHQLLPQRVHILRNRLAELRQNMRDELGIRWSDFSRDPAGPVLPILSAYVPEGSSDEQERDTLETYLRALFIDAFTSKDDNVLTPAAGEFILRAWQNRDELQSKLNYTDLGPLTDAFLANRSNYLDWKLVVDATNQEDPSYLDAETRILIKTKEDRIAQRNNLLHISDSVSESLTSRMVEQNRDRSRIVYEHNQYVRTTNPAYIRLAELGRPFPPVRLQMLPDVPPGGATSSDQDRQELQTHPQLYASDIYNYLLLRYEFAQCGETYLKAQSSVGTNGKGHLKQLAKKCRERLLARARSVGLVVPNDDAGKMSQYSAWLQRSDAQHQLEASRKIAHDMTMYEKRKQLFLESYVNAPDWAVIIDMRKHREREERRADKLNTFQAVMAADPTLKSVYQYEADLSGQLSPPLGRLLDAIKNRSDENPYYGELQMTVRDKVVRLAAHLLTDPRYRDLSLGQAEDNATTLAQRLLEKSYGSILHLVDTVKQSRFAAGWDGQRDLESEWYGNFWQVTPPPPRPYLQDSPAAIAKNAPSLPMQPRQPTARILLADGKILEAAVKTAHSDVLAYLRVALPLLFADPSFVEPGLRDQAKESLSRVDSAVYSAWTQQKKEEKAQALSVMDELGRAFATGLF